MKTGIERITAERERQVEEEGWTPEHDAEHGSGELAMAASCYASPLDIRAEIDVPVDCGCREADCPHTSPFGTRQTVFKWADPFPWPDWDKRGKHSRMRQLEIAGALVAAEIDRLLVAVDGKSSAG
ncbi:hypothetical protein LCGC14_1059430 [marine sediment metagenome]|uniref:Uncharacterized protein n=1 Tax=marine sediment metagenome TaxID=412755 RepID=A0A0F9Q4E6_9ZZZZ